MIKIIVSRNGMLDGTSIIPTRDVMNPYFLFGAECTEENQLKLKGFMNRAEEIWRECGRTSKGGVFPEYTLRTILLWQQGNSGPKGAISYPEAGVIPGLQSFMMCIFTAMQEAYPENEMIIITVSEYMVRMSQLLVAKKILSNDTIQVFDTDSDGKPQPLDFQLSDELSIA